ncbi:unnamed protein product, partial [Heterosigma akashiwo]
PQLTILAILTGGPCGGKTSCLSELKQILNKTLRGKARTFSTVEAATLTYSSGIERQKDLDNNIRNLLAFQKCLYTTQMALEVAILTLASELTAETKEDIILLIDRGPLDSKGYMAPQAWEELLRQINRTEEDIMNRYDIVVHLTSTAIGAESFYGTATNQFRMESLDQSRIQDGKEWDSWTQHPLHIRIPN